MSSAHYELRRDIGWSIRKRLYAKNHNAKRAAIAAQLCELGRFGEKTGKGWYAYAPGQRDALPDQIVEEIIVSYRKSAGITPRKVRDEEIVERCIYAPTNDGARILEESIVARGSDVNMVYLSWHGFPAHRGGPMLYAHMMGLPNVVRSMRRFALAPGGDARLWQPAALLVQLAEAGQSFS
ncbi:MAG: hypothetical protein HHJ09_04020 [Glaciimonas sp.]|nr:hypothetical protein [Glaciimonas sp.]